MIFVSLLSLINLSLLIGAVLSLNRMSMNRHERDVINHFGVLELAWAIFSILLGLFVLFDVIESMGERSSFFQATDGLTFATLSISFGFGVLHFYFFVRLMIKLARARSLEID